MKSRVTRVIGPVALTIALAIALAACGAESVEVPGETVVVKKEVVKEVQVPGETVVVEKVVTETVEVPGETVVKEVVKAPAAPVQQPLVKAQPEGFNTIGGSATVNDAAYDLTFFKHYGVNPFIDTEDDNLSTFAIDVDTASYTVARRFVQDGNLPHPDSVRVEEFINFFDQGYQPPEEDAFAIHIDGSPSPFGGDKHWLLRVGLQGRTVSRGRAQGRYPGIRDRRVRLDGSRGPSGIGEEVSQAARR